MTADGRRSLNTPVEFQAALTIGIVESVSPGRIAVRLELDAPQATALNTGTPIGFPRLNGFVVLPNEAGALVGLVVWLGIEQSNYPKRPGLKDFGLVDLPFPVRKMHVIPVGTLERVASGSVSNGFRLRRGVVAFPSVGDPVALPSTEQLDALTLGEAADRRVHIGRSLLGNDAEVRVDPDKLLGRHLAVLGNTGSGKSCSVAGLVRWSIESAQAALDGINEPNVRFLVLDPNGEYREALGDLPGFQLFQVPPVETAGAKPLRVPAWLLNSHEWASVTAASPRVQRPALTQALRDLRLGTAAANSPDERLAVVVAAFKVSVSATLNSGPEAWAHGFGGRMDTGGLLSSFKRTVEARLDQQKSWHAEANDLVSYIAALEGQLLNRGAWNAFDAQQLADVIDYATDLLQQLPVPALGATGNEDTPSRFDADLLADQLDIVATSAEFGDSARFLGSLKVRVRSLVADERIRPIIVPGDEPQLDEWLTEFLGDGAGACVGVIDLSLVPSDVVEVVVAVLGRMVFEALQRHRRLEGSALPTALILEEAHIFVRRYEAGDDYVSPAEMCVRAFERIAREGRKFGLGLVIASQRPSELSPTVLAQCNSFLLHRIVNDRDQSLVAKLIPDTLSGLLEDLPSLPARHALLLGSVAPLPTLFEVRELPHDQRPRSADPDFWDVWTGARQPKVDWASVSRRWVGIFESSETGSSSAASDPEEATNQRDPSPPDDDPPPF